MEGPLIESTILPKLGSDHWPVQLWVNTTASPKLKPFKFKIFWLSDTNFQTLEKLWWDTTEIQQGTKMYCFQQKKHKYFHWIEKAEKSFNLLKKKITEKPILVLLDFNKTFQVRCDTSGFSIGAVLSQDNRLFAYFNEKLNEAKIKYSTYDKVFYVVIQALKKWRHYLVPREFVLYNDNHALQFVTR